MWQVFDESIIGAGFRRDFMFAEVQDNNIIYSS